MLLILFSLVNQVVNKGMVSYRDPESAPGRGQRTLHVTSEDVDLSKLFSRAVRELTSTGEDGPEVDLDSVEESIRANYAVEVEPGVDFRSVLLHSSRRAAKRGMVTQVESEDGPGFRPSTPGAGNKGKQVGQIELIVCQNNHH